jgi:hypothetical protein
MKALTKILGFAVAALIVVTLGFKWQLGPLRLVNLIAFGCVIYWARKLLTRLFLIEPFIMLGKASLQVFCAHLAFVFIWNGQPASRGLSGRLSRVDLRWPDIRGSPQNPTRKAGTDTQ